MPLITYIDHEGTEREVDGKNGDSVMEAALGNGIPGLDADCGGGCACATCHVYVDDTFVSKVGEPDEMEIQMLEFADNVEANSRLSCQIYLTDDMEGARFITPEYQ